MIGVVRRGDASWMRGGEEGMTEEDRIWERREEKR